LTLFEKKSVGGSEPDTRNLTPNEMLIFLIIVILICVIVSGFFSGAETAFVSIDKPLLHAEAQKGNLKAKIAEKLLAYPAQLLTTTLIGTNVAIVIATTLATVVVSDFVPENFQTIVTTVIMTPLMLVFGELLPKSIGRGNAHGYTLFSAIILKIVQKIFSPVIYFILFLSNSLLRVFGIKNQTMALSVTREEVQALADISAEEGIIGDAEHKMIHRVFEMNRTTLASVMEPLVDIISVPATSSVYSVIELAEKFHYSHFPVYEEKNDNIIGTVHIVDILSAATGDPEKDKNKQLGSLIDKTVPFVPESRPVGNLLGELRNSQTKLVFAIDEYGGVTGMITTRDLAEEIVGELAVESEDQKLVFVRHRNGIDCDGKTDVDYIGEQLGIKFDKDGYDTIAGLILKIAGRVPAPGETFNYENISLKILRSDKKRIKKVRIGKAVL